MLTPEQAGQLSNDVYRRNVPFIFQGRLTGRYGRDWDTLTPEKRAELHQLFEELMQRVTEEKIRP